MGVVLRSGFVPSRLAPIAFASLASFVFAACSSSRDEAPLATTPAGNDGGPAVTSTFTDGGAPIESCVTARTNAAIAPVNLVFMFDQSGSMGDEAHGGLIFGYKRSERWDPVTNGVKRFVAEPASAGIRASLQYFPAETGSGCDVDYYKKPEVPLTALPNASPFIASINKHGPMGGTPTLPAVKGAIEYAKDLKAQFPQEKSAVVLVTDGEPSDCGSFDEVKALLAAEAANVQTYVVGVGNQLTALADLAKAGGTGTATLVDVSKSPQQTSDDLLKALAAIRGQTISCSLPIPPPPDGKAIDPAKVNVAVSAPGQSGDVLTYDATCASPDGWRYDDANAPKSIDLCPGACERARLAAGGAIEVQLGCATKGLK